MNYPLIHALIDQVADFQKEKQEGSLEEFAHWLLARVGANTSAEVINAPSFSHPKMTIDNVLTEFITYLYRYAKMYIKKIVEESQSAFTTYDDIVYVLILFFNPHEKITKTALIERNIHEKPTGMEVLKRLLKNGLIEQYDSEEDKRSKYLKVTTKGRIEFTNLVGKIYEASRLIGGNLTHREKEYLYFLLKKLHDFHNPIFINEKDSTFEVIFKKLG